MQQFLVVISNDTLYVLCYFGLKAGSNELLVTTGGKVVSLMSVFIRIDGLLIVESSKLLDSIGLILAVKPNITNVVTQSLEVLCAINELSPNGVKAFLDL